MAVVTIFSAAFCHGGEVTDRLADRLAFGRVTDEALFDAAAREFQVPRGKLERAMTQPPGFFNRLTREKERLTSVLRSEAVDLAAPDNLIFSGFGGLLLPPMWPHLLRVCLAAPRGYRVEEAISRGLSRKQAEKSVEEDDEARTGWTEFLFGLRPWDKSLYDTFLPMQTLSVDEAVEAICLYANRPMSRTDEDAREAVADARLAAKVDMALVERGYDTDVTCRGGAVTILIRQYRMRMQRFGENLEAVARRVPGVERVTARPGPRCQEPSVYPHLDVDIPPKVLLVDDEREFVQTLSERVQARSMQTAIAYDGEEALTMVDADQPEVMVLDLKMPGIDGLEVLRQVKQRHPETEVIILTGHGSDAEEQVAAQLGAFAYLRKPADIDLLTETLKRAHAKVEAARRKRGSDPADR